MKKSATPWDKLFNEKYTSSRYTKKEAKKKNREKFKTTPLLKHTLAIASLVNNNLPYLYNNKFGLMMDKHGENLFVFDLKHGWESIYPRALTRKMSSKDSIFNAISKTIDLEERWSEGIDFKRGYLSGFWNPDGVLNLKEGGFVSMGSKRHVDEIPALLTADEYVIDAKAVFGLGSGSHEQGAMILGYMQSYWRQQSKKFGWEALNGR